MVMNDIIAKFPISWVEFQTLMQSIGYDGMSIRQGNKTARFFRGGEHAQGVQDCVTVNLPTFLGLSGKIDSYERDYVADVLDRATGGDGGEVIATLLARRRLDS